MLFMLNVSVPAKSGNIIGKLYSTDILAYINGIPVPSYNIGGKTVVVLEELEKDYGVGTNWDDKTRTLSAYMVMPLNKSPYQDQVSLGKPGSVIGNIFETDIKTYVNGLPIQGYSLNGQMAVAIEDLGATAGAEYSPYNMRYVWDGTARTISLFFLADNTDGVYNMLRGKSLDFAVHNDQASLKIGYFYSDYPSPVYDGGFNPSAPYPVYCGGMRVGTGFRYTDGSDVMRGIDFDMDAMETSADQIDVPPVPYGTALQYFTNASNYGGSVQERADTDNCTFLYITTAVPMGSTEMLVRIAKDGGYYDYADDFQSVSLYGGKFFSNVRVDGSHVYFHYDSDYVIDLETGVMTKK